MRPRHGHSRLRWAGGIAAALALLAGALIWSAAPRGEPDGPAAPVGISVAMATPQQQPLPALPALPVRESAVDPAQSLAPPLVAEQNVAGTRPAKTAPTALASLDLTLLQPCGAPAIGVDLDVSAPQSNWKGSDPRHSTRTGPAGRILLPGLPAHTPLRLRGTDSMGYDVLPDLQLTLAPGEQRVLIETVSRDLRRVIVQVRDRSGQPVDGATITLVAALTQGSTRTLQTVKTESSFDLSLPDPRSEHGDAVFSCMAAESVSVSAELGGFAPVWVTDMPLDRDPLRLELLLDPGFRVEVEIVDESGRPRDVDAVAVRGAPVTMLAGRIDRGRYRFTAYPDGARGITASVQGRSWKIEHDPRQPVARMVVPAGGALSVTWARLSDACEPTGIFIYSEPPGWGWFEPVDDATRATRGPVLFEDLAPGEYRVELHCPESHAADRSARATVSSNVTTSLVLEQ